MRPPSNPNKSSLIEGLESVNAAVEVVHCAWRHFATWQEVGGRCAMSARRLTVARGLLIEAIEDWALAVGRLLALSRAESGLGHLSENLERSLCRAAAYLSAMVMTGDAASGADSRFLPH